jgi:hypothetical protein
VARLRALLRRPYKGRTSRTRSINAKTATAIQAARTLFSSIQLNQPNTFSRMGEPCLQAPANTNCSIFSTIWKARMRSIDVAEGVKTALRPPPSALLKYTRRTSGGAWE